MAAKEIIVIGGGASGLMAAVTAARRGARVTILEHQPACGKKILATGNGRCNLTNLQKESDSYRSHAPKAVEKVLRRFSVEDTLDFFSDLGLYIRNKNGWIYPYSQQARTVLQLLLGEVSRLGVKLKTEAAIQKIQKVRGKWKLTTDTETYQADAVILAAGSKASNLPGADGSGYALAKSLGHRIYPVLPALVPLVGEGDYFRQWEGIRMDARISLHVNGNFVKQESGELQLTGYGVSGIPIFQLSRYAVEGISHKKRAELRIDFFPDGSERKLEHLLQTGKNRFPRKTWEEILSGIFPEKFSRIVARRSKKAREEEQPRRIAQNIKHWKVSIRGWQDYTYAQVCMGGVDFGQVDADTLESRLHAGFYFAGEILDVDGACGGYNLQWAWSSGAVAAMACTDRKEERKPYDTNLTTAASN